MLLHQTLALKLALVGFVLKEHFISLVLRIWLVKGDGLAHLDAADKIKFFIQNSAINQCLLMLTPNQVVLRDQQAFVLLNLVRSVFQEALTKYFPEQLVAPPVRQPLLLFFSGPPIEENLCLLVSFNEDVVLIDF